LGGGAGRAEAGRAEAGSPQWWAERMAADARRRPRVGGLSTERLVDAAIEVLREGGLEALTVREVAHRLDTSSASLYRHITSRDELLVLIVDRSLGAVRLPRDGTRGGWRERAESLMREVRHVLLHHPLPVGTVLSRPVWGPNTLRVVDAFLTIFLDAGLDAEQATHAASTLLDFVVGSAAIQRGNAGRWPRGEAQETQLDRLTALLPDDDLRGLRAAGAAFTSARASDVFIEGLAIVLDGIAHRVQRGAPPPARP
ncbi:TetR/AcrR family transcriptional regulator, partial [Frankia canadensis]